MRYRFVSDLPFHGRTTALDGFERGALARLRAKPDAEVIEALTAVRGLGRWTADWFLARHLARPHAWPAGDLGMRKAVSTFYAAGRPLSEEEDRAMGERFAQFQNLSAQFLIAGARLMG